MTKDGMTNDEGPNDERMMNEETTNDEGGWEKEFVAVVFGGIGFA